MGSGNRLVFGQNVKLSGVTFRFGIGRNTVELQDNANVRGQFSVSWDSRICVGKNTRFGKPCWLQALEMSSINIGAECLFANVRIRTSDVHSILDKDSGKRLNMARDVNIGKRVWIAERAYVYKGAQIGNDCVIGAHAVVTGEIPDNCVAVGHPAKVVRNNIVWTTPPTAEDGSMLLNFRPHFRAFRRAEWKSANLGPWLRFKYLCNAAFSIFAALLKDDQDVTDV